MNKTIPQSHSIESEQLHIRMPELGDIPHIYEALHSDGFMDGMTSEPPFVEILQKSRANWLQGESYSFSAYLKANNEFVGRGGIRVSEEAGVWLVSYYIHPKCQSQGYATELAGELLRFGFTELEAKRIDAFHAAFNKASQIVLEKIGMGFVAKIPNSFRKNGQLVTDNHYAIHKIAWMDLTNPN